MNSSVLVKVERELRQLQQAISKLSGEFLSASEKVLESRIRFYLSEVKILLASTKEEIRKMELDKNQLQWNLFENNYDTYTQIAREILYKHVVQACDMSEEFGKEPFRSALIGVTRHPLIAVLYRYGMIITLDYQMNDIAGFRYDYFRAVEAASLINREEAATDADPTTKFKLEQVRAGERLSDLFWEEKIYDADYNQDIIQEYGDAYEKIVDLRFNEFKTPAPFWELLDQGNTSPKREPGGRGIGKPYPEQKPTHFVSLAKEESLMKIMKELEKDVKKGEKEIDRNIEMLYKAVSVYEGIFKELTNIADNLRLKILRQVAELKQAVYERALENISKSQKAQKIKFTTEMKTAIETKAEETAYKILAGFPIEQAYLGAYGGTKGSRSYQVRVRTIDLVKDVAKRVDIKVIDKIQNIADNLFMKIIDNVTQYRAIRDFANQVLKKRGR